MTVPCTSDNVDVLGHLLKPLHIRLRYLTYISHRMIPTFLPLLLAPAAFLCTDSASFLSHASSTKARTGHSMSQPSYYRFLGIQLFLKLLVLVSLQAVSVCFGSKMAAL